MVKFVNQAQKVGLVAKSWDIHFTFPYLEFRFGLTVPDPRKERFITQRDKLGRIVHSRCPEILL